MTWLWLMPAAIVVVGLVPLVMMMRAAAEEAAGAAREIRRLGELRPALALVRTEADAVAQQLRSLGR